MVDRNGLALMLLALLVTGCAGTTPVETGALGVGAGWRSYEIYETSERFLIALPPGWRQVALGPEIEKAVRDDPETAALPETYRDILVSSLKFAANESIPGATDKPAVMVFKYSTSPHAPLDAMVTYYVATLQNRPDVLKPVSRRRVNLPAGDAEQVEFRIGSGTIVEYWLLRGTDGYRIVFAVRTDRAPKYRPVFEKIGETFRIIVP
jgi:hypothetical protein